MKNAVALILNYNDANNSLSLAEKLADFDIFECILIVDNFSIMDDINILKQNNNPSIKVLFSSYNRMYSGGINYGINYLKDNFKRVECCLIINSDIIVDKTVIDESIEIINKEEGISIVSPSMLNYKGKMDCVSGWKKKNYLYLLNMCSFIGRRINKKRDNIIQNTEKHYVDAIRGSFMMCRFKDIIAIGGLDENILLYYGEDILGIKLKNMNKKILVLDNCFYIHNHILNNNNDRYRYKICLRDGFYYYKTYLKRNIFRSAILWLFMQYGKFEHFFIEIFLKHVKRK